MRAIFSPAIPSILGGLLAGCTPDPGADDTVAYAEALTAVRADPTTAAVACARVGDLDLRADCTTAAVEVLALDREPAAAELCRSLPEGVGRDECWFQLADVSGSAAWCGDAGRFRDDCRMHLWTQLLLARLPRNSTPAEAVTAARPLLAQTDFTEDDGRPWVAVFRMSLGPRRPFDRSLCDAIEDATLTGICRDAGRDLYGDLLNHARDKGRFPCDGGPLPTELQTAPDPELAALVEARREVDLCPPG